jgi:multicomponent Na+:H+ antiporter subunit D
VTHLPVLVVVLPLFAAALTALVRRSPVVQRVITIATLTAVTVIGGVLVAATAGGGIVATVVGGHPAALGIALTVDPLGAVMVLVTGVLALAAVAAMSLRRDDGHPFAHPVVLVMLTGVWGSFVTGDLFNLFVAFETTLIASYVLLVLDGTRRQARAGAVYVTVNLLGSLVFLAGVGLLYGTAGTVNLAQLAAQPTQMSSGAIGPALVVLAFAVKAALLPFSGWLRVAYPVAPRAVSPLFAGLLTTVGVVAMYRVMLLSFGEAPVLRQAILVAAIATAIAGGLATLAVTGPAPLLAHVVLAQAGFMAVGVGIGTVDAVAAGIFFVVQDVVIKTALFLGAFATDDVATDGVGLVQARPILAVTVAVAGLSLAGFPPLSGFVGKALLIRSAFDAGLVIASVGMLVASFGVLVAVGRLWRGIVWRTVADEVTSAVASRGRRRVTAVPAMVLASAAILIGVVPGPLHELATRAAEVLTDPAAYARTVLGGER